MTEEVKRLNVEIPELNQLYAKVEEIRSEELVAANRKTKTSHTRMRVALSTVAKLAKVIRKKLQDRVNNL